MRKVSLIVAMALVMGMAVGCNDKAVFNDAGIVVDGVIEIKGTEDEKVVEDAVFKEADNKYISPVGYEIDSIIEGIRGSVAGVEFEDSYYEMIENAGMSGYFDFEKSHTLVGYSTEDRESRIQFTVKQYANFDKASYIMVNYNKEDVKLEKAAQSLLINLYGESLVSPLFDKEEHLETVVSESGEFQFEVSKFTDEMDEGTFITMTLDYAPIYVRENLITDFEAFEKTAPLYKEMAMFRDVPLKDMANVLGEVWGDYKHGVLVRNTNSKAGAVDGNTRSMELTNAVMFEDGMQSAVEIQAVVQEGENLNSELSINGSTPYCDTAEEAIAKAVKMLEFIGEAKLELLDEEVAVGIDGREWEIKQFGKNLKQKVYIDLEADEAGYYAVFETFTVIQ